MACTLTLLLLLGGDVETNPGPSKQWLKNQADKKRYLLHREEILAKKRLQYADTPEHKKEVSKFEYVAIPQRKRAIAKANYAANPQQKSVAINAAYAANPQPKWVAVNAAYAANPQPKRDAAEVLYAANPQPKRVVVNAAYAAKPCQFHPRQVKLTVSEYAKSRLLNKDSRFRKEAAYVFFLLWQCIVLPKRLADDLKYFISSYSHEEAYHIEAHLISDSPREIWAMYSLPLDHPPTD